MKESIECNRIFIKGRQQSEGKIRRAHREKWEGEAMEMWGRIRKVKQEGAMQENKWELAQEQGKKDIKLAKNRVWDKEKES
jgi:hypothetical protein